MKRNWLIVATFHQQFGLAPRLPIAEIWESDNAETATAIIWGSIPESLHDEVATVTCTEIASRH